MAPTETPPPAPNRTECRDCVYWSVLVRNGHLPDEGECHRFPPVAMPMLATEHATKPVFYWPDTTANEWCGEASRIGSGAVVRISGPGGHPI